MIKKTPTVAQMAPFMVAFLVAMPILSTLLIGAPAAQAATPNLISNPSFEMAGGASGALGWETASWGDASTSQFSLVSPGQDGSVAAQVTIPSYSGVGEGNGAAEWYFDNVAVTPGSTYAFSNWYKSNTESYLIAQWTLSDASFSYDTLATLPSTGGTWTASPVEVFTAPLNAISLTVLHLVQSAGTLAVDNYSLTPYTSTGQNSFPKPIVSLTFDDGYTSQYNNALPILNAAGMHGTFYIITQDVAGSADNLFNDSQVSTSTVTTNSAAIWSGLYVDPTFQQYVFSDNYSATASTTITAIYLLNGEASSTVIGTLPASAHGTANFNFTLPTNSGGGTASPITLSQALTSAGTLTASSPSLSEYQTYMSYAQLLGLQAAGNEIDSHTETHPDLTALTSAAAEQEISGSRTALAGLGLSPVDTLAYPFGNYSISLEQQVANTGYIAARTVDVGYNDESANPLLLKSYSVVASTTLDTVKALIDTAVANKWWLILTFHDIDPANIIAQNGETYGITPGMLQNILSYLAQHEQSNTASVETIDQAIASLKPAPTTGSLAITKTTTGGDGTFGFSGSNGIGNFQISTTGGTGSTTIASLAPGNYSVTENSLAQGWSQTGNTCNSVQVVAGQAASCAISNTFTPVVVTPPTATSTLTVSLQNDPSGSAVSSDFNLNVTDGTTTLFSGSAQDSQSYTVNVGDSYNVTESTSTSSANYSVGLSGSCSGTVASTDAITCSITNTFNPAPTPTPTPVPVSGGGGGGGGGGEVYGTISGNIFNDLNANGIKDSGEPGFADWKIYLDQNNNGQLDNGEYTTTSDQNGNYIFSVPSNTYNVREIPQAGFSQTLPATDYVVTFPAGVYQVTGKNFGNASGQVLGEATTTPSTAITPAPTPTPTPSTVTIGNPTGGICTPYITKNLAYGAHGSQVTKLQQFLNQFEGAGLPVTGYYGSMTRLAVKAFQLKYKSQILAPLGLTLPTGSVYKMTLLVINQLECGQ